MASQDSDALLLLWVVEDGYKGGMGGRAVVAIAVAVAVRGSGLKIQHEGRHGGERRLWSKDPEACQIRLWKHGMAHMCTRMSFCLGNGDRSWTLRIDMDGWPGAEEEDWG